MKIIKAVSEIDDRAYVCALRMHVDGFKNDIAFRNRKNNGQTQCSICSRYRLLGIARQQKTGVVILFLLLLVRDLKW